MLALVLMAAAIAGSGPWILGPGDQSVYLGMESQRFTRFAGGGGSTDADAVVDVGDGISTIGVKAIGSYGIASRVEAELVIPWSKVRQNSPEKFPCPDLGLDACETSTGVGVITGRLKGVLLDEVLGPPVTLTAGAEVRHGELTHPERARITNLGEGTTDLGGFASVGRVGGMASGYWSAYLEAGARHRFPNTQLQGAAAPSAEVFVLSEAMVAPNRVVALGPTLTWFQRPAGQDFETVDLGNPDRFGALRVQAAQGGAKVLLRSGTRVTWSGGVLRTLYSLNNPSDVLTINVGMSVRDLWPNKTDTP